MHQQRKIISQIKGGEAADLVHLAPMRERPDSYTYDPPAVLSPHGAFEDPTGPADVLPRESLELGAIASHSV